LILINTQILTSEGKLENYTVDELKRIEDVFTYASPLVREALHPFGSSDFVSEDHGELWDLFAQVGQRYILFSITSILFFFFFLFCL
jgi:hypothetical protein